MTATLKISSGEELRALAEPHPLACLNLTPDQRKAWNEKCASEREKLRHAGVIPNLSDPASQWAVWQYYG